MVAVFIWNITVEVDPVPEMLVVNCVFNVPCTVLVPTADTNEQEENEQAILGKLKYYDNDTDD